MQKEEFAETRTETTPTRVFPRVSFNTVVISVLVLMLCIALPTVASNGHGQLTQEFANVKGGLK